MAMCQNWAPSHAPPKSSQILTDVPTQPKLVGHNVYRWIEQSWDNMTMGNPNFKGNIIIESSKAKVTFSSSQVQNPIKSTFKIPNHHICLAVTARELPHWIPIISMVRRLPSSSTSSGMVAAVLHHVLSSQQNRKVVLFNCSSLTFPYPFFWGDYMGISINAGTHFSQDGL